MLYLLQIDVIFCQSHKSTELYRIQYPIRKVNPFSRGILKARFKKNVKMLETRFPVDRSSNSFDKGRAEHLASVSGTGNGAIVDDSVRVLDEEVYVGRSFGNDSPVHYAVGFFKNQRLYICPLNGTLDMKRSIAYMNNQGKGRTAKLSDDDLSESEEEASTNNLSPIRVKFKHHESERQKKRREQSSAHRRRQIEQDPWTPMHISCETDSESMKYLNSLLSVPIKLSNIWKVPDPEQLVLEAIIGEKMSALDLNNCNQLISQRRIRHLPEVQQIRALMIKARCISTDEVQRYVAKCIPRHLLISHIRECAHLVCNIWVLKSELLYNDEKTLTLQYARDLVLCLFNCGLPVKRSDLQQAFGLNAFDVESILRTFNRVTVNGTERSWILKHDDAGDFGKNKDELKILIDEKRFWHKRWEEIHRYLVAEKEKMGAILNKRRSSGRRNSTGCGVSKKRVNTKTVVID